MISLSALIDSQVCSAVECDRPADLLRFGCHVADPGAVTAPVETLARWISEAVALKKVPGFTAPSKVPRGTIARVLGTEVVNDLYTPGLRSQDGVLYFSFPMTGGPRSTESVICDYGFLLLALTANPYAHKNTTIFEAWWPSGDVVRGLVEPQMWEAAGRIVKTTLNPPTGRRHVGPACHRCLNQKGCRPWEALDDILMAAPTAEADAKQASQRLWLEWVMLKEQDTRIEGRRAHVATRLAELAVNGVVDVNGILKLDVRATERTTYGIDQVQAILGPAGLWKPEYGAVRNGELNKDLPGFPPAVRAQIARVAKTVKTAPTVREAAAGTGNAVSARPFFGVA